MLAEDVRPINEGNRTEMSSRYDNKEPSASFVARDGA